MRFLSITLLTALVLTLGVSTASAFEVRLSPRNSAGPLQPGDTVTFDVFFDADQTGLLVFSVAVLFDPTFLEYKGPESAALPIIYPAPAPAYGTTGAEPAYLLYTAGSTGMPPIPATALYPQQTPNWLTWPGNKPPNTNQVNINYAEGNITDTFNTMVTGTNLWIGSIVLQVRDTAPNGDSTVQLCNTCGGNVLSIGLDEVPPETIPLVGATTVTVPEPATLGLAMAAVASLSLYAARLRRRRRS